MSRIPQNISLTALSMLLALPAAADDKTAVDPSPTRRAIDSGLFVASGADVRSFEVEAVIGASAERVFAAFTDSAAFKEGYGPDREELTANIDLAVGGDYEWLFDGKTGSNGCQVLSYVPNRMVSFSWNAPPSQEESRGLHTWVVVELTPTGTDSTRVRVTHLGFGTQAHWDETFVYFQRAWPVVLGNFKKHLGG